MADAFAALLTPPGAAAVATVAVAGPDAWSVVCSLFRLVRGQDLPEEIDPSRHWTGQFGTPPGDTVVLTARRQDRNRWIEIHSHGGRRVVQWLLDELSKAGCTVCESDDFLSRSGQSRLRNQAAMALTRAPTARIAGILLDQFRGALDAAITEIVVAIERGDIPGAERRLDEVLQYSNIGRRLVSGWRIAVCGPPNVGKSSLINRLSGYARCIVTPTPGTTRDAVAVSMAIDGWPVHLVDTAGQRSTVDTLERTGIERAQEEMAGADLVLWLDDAASPQPAYPPESPSQLFVINKIDLVAEPPTQGDAAISAATGQGIDDLLSIIGHRLVPQIPPAGAVVPFTEELVEQLSGIAQRISASDLATAIVGLRNLTA